VAVVKPGRILYEMIGVPEDVARGAFRTAAQKIGHHDEVRVAHEGLMKAAKWREFSPDELQQKARELTEEIFNLRFQLSMGVAKNPSRLSQAKKDLARANTVLARRRAPPVGERKSREGVVVSGRDAEDARGADERVFRHPRYQRVVRASKEAEGARTRPTRAGWAIGC